MIPEVIGALGLVVAAVITGLFHRMRRENSEAHGRAIETLDRIATTVEDIDEAIDEMATWQEDHQRLHDLDRS